MGQNVRDYFPMDDKFQEQGGTSTMDPNPFRRFLGSKIGTKIASYEYSNNKRLKFEQKRKKLNKPHVIEYFHQVDDPYSHLAAQLLKNFKSKYDVQIKCYLVSQVSDSSIPEPELLQKLSIRDAMNIAPHYDLLFPNGAQAPSKKWIDLAQTVLVSMNDEKFIDNIFNISTALWGGDLDTLNRFFKEFVSSGEIKNSTIINENNAKRKQLGHYSAAMFYYGNEWYWGIDRLYHLETRLKELALDLSEKKEVFIAPKKEITFPKLKPNNKFLLEFFPSMRSPYTALIFDRVLDFSKRCNLKLSVRPVLPMVMRGVPLTLDKSRYIMMDVAREARANGISFGNFYDPIGEPVRNCYSLYSWARDCGRSNQLLSSFLRAAFVEGKNLNKQKNFKYVIDKAGLDWSHGKTIIGNSEWHDELEDNRLSMYETGLWGVPSFRLYRGDKLLNLGWGQDRLWTIGKTIKEQMA